ncbi:choice-of-anchor P family protein [Actinomadura sp. WMMA1423]|uniref:choice-of-anchor P family protein n=1 Tax=Actinomadura sp. WMMA1423 TaxID=2591108 RepID=UPI00197A9500|nr:choice-of-anchor P family protein [Actinomadura sp. WMMA1423]
MRLQALTKCAAVAGALALPFALSAAPASAAPAAGPGGAGSAVAIAATGSVVVPPTSSVASAAQRPASKSVAELPANPLIEARLLNGSAWAGHGRASVTDLRVARLGLSAHAVSAKCENGAGVSHVAGATLGARALKVGATPNTTVTTDLKGLGNVTVTLNKQVRGQDGNLTVTAIEVSATLAGKTQTISIASATCGKSGGGQPGQPGEPSQPSQPGKPTPAPTPPGEAPAPTPVPGDLPVTG